MSSRLLPDKAPTFSVAEHWSQRALAYPNHIQLKDLAAHMDSPFSNRSIRKRLLPIFARVNPGDITIRNHHTRDRLRLHSFRHKGYWFHGRKREAATMNLFKVLISPGDVVVDVGGHIGYITQLFSKLVGPSGRVFVFEPGPNNLPYLRVNVGDLPNVSLIESGVGASSGHADFYVESLTGQNNSFLSNFDVLAANSDRAGVQSIAQRIQVPITTLDEENESKAWGRVNFVKIDVEGYEKSVLEGAAKLLGEVHPMLMVELHANLDSMTAIALIAKQNGYQVFTDELEEFTWENPAPGNTFWFHQHDHAMAISRLLAEGTRSAD